MPIYRSVADQITQRIDSGVWPAGTILPAEIALAQEFRVSVGTLRRALGELTAGGVLSRRRKTGTVVTGRTPHHSLRIVYNYFRLHSRAGGLQTSTVRVLDCRRRLATETEAGRLALELQCEVHDIHRLRLVNGRPVMHEKVIIPVHLAPAFPSEPGKIPDRIYLSLWQDHGVKISAIREQLEAVLADDCDRQLLDLPEPAAVLLLNEVAYDESARPVLLNLHRATTREDVYINEVQ